MMLAQQWRENRMVIKKPKDTLYTSNYEARGTTAPTMKDVQRVQGSEEQARLRLEAKKQACLAKGWFWDEATQTCNQEPKFNIDVDKALSEKPKIQGSKAGAYDPRRDGFVTDTGDFYPTSNPEFKPSIQTDKNIKFGEGGNVTITGADNKPITLTAEEYNTYLNQTGVMTEDIRQAQSQPNIQQLQAQQLGGQVGQFGELPISPTGLDVGEAAITGIINAIPKALSLGVTGAIAGAAIGGGVGAIGAPITGGVSAIGGAALGAVGGFISGITSSMISNFRSQRTDTINAQKRVLDEGKQNLNDWATLAATDPANRAIYVARFNQQLALIDQAYRNMKLDTSRDLAKFEGAVPDLAEFEAFYMAQGERDFLNARMRLALGVQQDPEFVYQIAELQQRRMNENQ